MYFKMTMMPLVPETTMVDVVKLISLGNLLVRKVTWLVLTTTSVTLILSCAFGADCMTTIANINSRLPSTHSLTLRLTEMTHSLHFDSQRQHTLSLLHLTSSSQPHENVYILQPFSFLSCLFS